MKALILVLAVIIISFVCLLGFIGGMIFILKIIFDVILWNSRRKARKGPKIDDPPLPPYILCRRWNRP